MKLKRIFISTMFGLAALKLATMIYAAIEVKIPDIATAQELDEFLKTNPSAVVEFHDLNCPVCQAFQRKGIFKETALALPHIKFAKVSVQQGQGLHKEYQIHNYPTFIFFKDGKKIEFTRDDKKVDRFLGYVDNPGFTRKTSDIFAHAELAAKNDSVGQSKTNK
jgi:thiol-disulfide isomerase/thioredoxin